MYSLDIAVNSLTYILWSLLIIKKTEYQRIDVCHLQCWRRHLRVPWTARRSNSQSSRKAILNIHWKEWCWSWRSNILAIWCEELTHQERTRCWERLRAGGEEGDRGWDRWLDGITDYMNMSLSNLWEMVNDREAWHAAIHGLQKVWNDFSTEQWNCLEVEAGAESAEWPVQHSIAYKWWSQIAVFTS